MSARAIFGFSRGPRARTCAEHIRSTHHHTCARNRAAMHSSGCAVDLGPGDDYSDGDDDGAQSCPVFVQGKVGWVDVMDLWPILCGFTSVFQFQVLIWFINCIKYKCVFLLL